MFRLAFADQSFGNCPELAEPQPSGRTKAANLRRARLKASSVSHTRRPGKHLCRRLLSATWNLSLKRNLLRTQTHTYAGWFALGMFVMHQAQAQPPSASGFPPPGEYRIDSESSITSAATGIVSIKRVQRVDGATGQITVITTSSLPGEAPTTIRHPGTGPVTRCVAATSSAPHTEMAPGLCDTTLTSSDSSGMSLSAMCSGTKQDESWHLVDNDIWEHQLLVVPRASAPAPTSSEVEQAMKPVYAELEKTIRTGPPEEAASAREQLKALRAHAPVAGGAPPFVTHLHERWTRVAQTCSAQR